MPYNLKYVKGGEISIAFMDIVRSVSLFDSSETAKSSYIFSYCFSNIRFDPILFISIYRVIIYLYFDARKIFIIQISLQKLSSNLEMIFNCLKFRFHGSQFFWPKRPVSINRMIEIRFKKIDGCIYTYTKNVSLPQNRKAYINIKKQKCVRRSTYDPPANIQLNEVDIN